MQMDSDSDQSIMQESPNEPVQINVCPICLDKLSNTGDHRICALIKCGHVFGKSCLNTWFNIQGKDICPVCKGKASQNKIIDIYVETSAVAANTTEQQLKMQLDNVTQEKNRLQLKLEKSNSGKLQAKEAFRKRNKANKKQIEALGKEVKALRKQNKVLKKQSKAIRKQYKALEEQNVALLKKIALQSRLVIKVQRIDNGNFSGRRQ